MAFLAGVLCRRPAALARHNTRPVIRIQFQAVVLRNRDADSAPLAVRLAELDWRGWTVCEPAGGGLGGLSARG